VLYRFPDLAGQKVACVVAGERDADPLADLSLPATTSPGRAGKWHEEYAEQLHAGGVESVAVFPDNDTPGESHALAVVRSCVVCGAGLAPRESWRCGPCLAAVCIALGDTARLRELTAA
jgi:hypothetical protein